MLGRTRVFSSSPPEGQWKSRERTGIDRSATPSGSGSGTSQNRSTITLVAKELHRTLPPDSPMAEDLASHGEETLKGWIDWAKQLDVELPKALVSGTSLGGRPLTPDLRASYEGDLAAAREIVVDAARMKVATPTATLVGSEARLVLHRRAGGQPRRIVIAEFGRGHTRGDLVVWLPTESILATGDLLVVPVPLVGADQSYVEDWVKTLERLQELGAAVTVPGHGQVQRDSLAAERYRDFLASVARQTRAAMDRGEAADKALEGLDVESFRQQMAGDDKVLNFLFGVWGKGPSVQAMYREREESKAANSGGLARWSPGG